MPLSFVKLIVVIVVMCFMIVLLSAQREQLEYFCYI
jgi:hypothetical protein